MLNISEINISKLVNQKDFSALDNAEKRVSGNVVLRLFIGFTIAGLVVLFLPWTQNIRARGEITTLKPDQRPQTIHSVIAGRVEKWFVQEGDFVHKGDTILFISEVKDEYFDPQLLDRTDEQLKAKEMAVQSYMEKVKAQDNQVDALVQTSRLKMQQARNKVKQANLKIASDSIDFQAYQLN
ncbi:MAG: biotin/lipoyl-binding protein, partial [Flavobacteriales bacterium]|nr:biotin/lipoyl-binding protein [Flavobacteriales bacterium]